MGQGVAATPQQVAVALAAREAGASLRQAAEVAGVKNTTISRYEHERDAPVVQAVDAPLLASEKRRWARDIFRVARQAWARTEDQIGQLGGYQAALVAGIATQRALEVEASIGGGQPAQEGSELGTLRVTARGRELLEALADVLEEGMAARRSGVIEAEVVANDILPVERETEGLIAATLGNSQAETPVGESSGAVGQPGRDAI